MSASCTSSESGGSGTAKRESQSEHKSASADDPDVWRFERAGVVRTLIAQAAVPYKDTYLLKRMEELVFLSRDSKAKATVKARKYASGNRTRFRFDIGGDRVFRYRFNQKHSKRLRRSIVAAWNRTCGATSDE